MTHNLQIARAIVTQEKLDALEAMAGVTLSLEVAQNFMAQMFDLGDAERELKKRRNFEDSVESVWGYLEDVKLQATNPTATNEERILIVDAMNLVGQVIGKEAVNYD